MFERLKQFFGLVKHPEVQEQPEVAKIPVVEEVVTEVKEVAKEVTTEPVKAKPAKKKPANASAKPAAIKGTRAKAKKETTNKP